MIDIEQLKKRLCLVAKETDLARDAHALNEAIDALSALQSDIEERKRAHAQLLVAHHMAQHEANQTQAENAGLRKEIENLTQDVESRGRSIIAEHEEAERLRQELEEARKDSELLDYFDKNPRSVKHSTGYLGAPDSWAYRDAYGATYDAANLREAIRTARQQGANPHGR